jgi:hypothetical protein
MSVDVRLLYIITVSILPVFSPAQEWVARYDGPVNSEDQALALAVDSAGNVYVTGASVDSATGADYATVKYDSAGIQQWVARYGGLGIDMARGISVDDAGNVYVTGSSYGGVVTDFDYATVKYDSLGVEQWVARYSSFSDYPDCAYAIAIDNAGCVYVTGAAYDQTNANYATIKYSSSGVEQWVTIYGSLLSQDEAYAVALDAEANVIVTGASSDQLSSFDYATIKYDSTGTQQWVARYDGPASSADFVEAMSIDDAGNIYVTGCSGGQGTGFDYATVKYNASGIEQWVARYNGPFGDDRAYAIAVDDARNVYVTGKSNDSGTGPDYATVKYDSLGIEQWVARYDGPANGEDYAYAVAISNAGNICVTGYSYGVSTDEDYATIMYDSSGIELWIERYNGPGNGWDEARAIAIHSEPYVYVTGSSMGEGTHMYYATIKYTYTGINEYKSVSTISNRLVLTIFSGPLLLPNGKKCKVFDITGRVVEPDKIQPGIYFIEIDGVVTQKIVKVR